MLATDISKGNFAIEIDMNLVTVDYTFTGRGLLFGTYIGTKGGVGSLNLTNTYFLHDTY